MSQQNDQKIETVNLKDEETRQKVAGGTWHNLEEMILATPCEKGHQFTPEWAGDLAGKLRQAYRTRPDWFMQSQQTAGAKGG